MIIAPDHFSSIETRATNPLSRASQEEHPSLELELRGLNLGSEESNRREICEGNPSQRHRSQVLDTKHIKKKARVLTTGHL